MVAHTKPQHRRKEESESECALLYLSQPQLNLWNVLPSCFPESCSLPFFKSKINKLDLISLSS